MQLKTNKLSRQTGFHHQTQPLINTWSLKNPALSVCSPLGLQNTLKNARAPPTCSQHVLTAGSGDFHRTKEAPPHVVRSGASDMSEDVLGEGWGLAPSRHLKQPGKSS